MKSFLFDIINLFRSRALMLVSTLLTTIIIARLLGPDKSGYIDSITIYPELFNSVLAIGMMQSITYHLGKYQYNRAGIYGNLIPLSLFCGIAYSIICYFSVKSIIPNDQDKTIVTLIAISPLFFNSFNTYISSVYLGNNDIKSFSKINWIPNAIKLFLVATLSITYYLNIYNILISYLLGPLIMAIVLYINTNKKVNLKFDIDYKIVLEIVKLGFVYSISLLIINLNYKIGIILLQKYSSHHEIGIYTKGASIVEKLWEIPSFMGSAIFARSAISKDASVFSEKVCALLRICVIVITLFSIAFFIFSNDIMNILYGERFAKSSGIQQILIPGIVLMTIFKVLNTDLQGRGRPWIAMIAMFPSLIVSILLNYILDEKYGATGAAIASSVGYSLAALFFLHLYSKEVNIKIKKIILFSKSDYDLLNSLRVKLNEKLQLTFK